MKKVLMLLFCLIDIFGISSCAAGEVKETTAVYQSVAAPTRWSLDTTLNKNFVGQPPLYVIESRVLYLLIQSSRPVGGIATEVRFEEWTVEKLQNLVRQEKITQFLPNTEKQNGGIDWIEVQELKGSE